jgi:transposase
MSLEPLIEACRPKGKTPPKDLRRTISAIVWRHQNGAKWRAILVDLGPWSRAAQSFIRWARLGRPIQVDTNLHLDGRKIGSAVTRYQAAMANGPSHGGQSIDGTRQFAGPDAAYLAAG